MNSISVFEIFLKNYFTFLSICWPKLWYRLLCRKKKVKVNIIRSKLGRIRILVIFLWSKLKKFDECHFLRERGNINNSLNPPPPPLLKIYPETNHLICLWSYHVVVRSVDKIGLGLPADCGRHDQHQHHQGADCRGLHDLPVQKCWVLLSLFLP